MYAEIEEMSVDVTRYPKYDRVQTDLIIKHAQPTHSGLYECQISSTKIYNYIVQLNVLGKYIFQVEAYTSLFMSCDDLLSFNLPPNASSILTFGLRTLTALGTINTEQFFSLPIFFIFTLQQLPKTAIVFDHRKKKKKLRLDLN